MRCPCHLPARSDDDERTVVAVRTSMMRDFVPFSLFFFGPCSYPLLFGFLVVFCHLFILALPLSESRTQSGCLYLTQSLSFSFPFPFHSRLAFIPTSLISQTANEPTPRNPSLRFTVRRRCYHLTFSFFHCSFH